MERIIGEVFYDERLKKQIKCIACEPGICDPCIYHAHGLPKTMPYEATLMHCEQTYGCTLDIFRRMSNKLLALLANAIEEMEGEDAAE